MSKTVSEAKLERIVETYINGIKSDFWLEVRKLSRYDRQRLIGVISESFSDMVGLDIARRIISGKFQ